MTCRELADFMMAYLSEELPAGKRSAFNRHLHLCANCRTYLASYEESVKLGRRAFDDENAEVPPEVPADLVKAILAARRTS